MIQKFLQKLKNLRIDQNLKIIQHNYQSLFRNFLHIFCCIHKELAKKLGVDLRTGTKGEKLLYDGKAKRICGVRLSSKAGVKNVEAKDGVVIATGGFARNKALLEKYVPRMKNASTICAMGCDGDGLKMALAYGADVADMPYIKATFAFNLKATSIKDACWVFRDGAIVLNKEGKRFCNEEISKKDIGDYVLDQPDAVAFNLYDDAIRSDAIGMEEYAAAGQFPRASILPKMAAGASFVSGREGRVAVIAELTKAREALYEKAGTVIRR